MRLSHSSVCLYLFHHAADMPSPPKFLQTVTSLPLLTVAGALLLFPSFYWEAGAAHPGGHRHQTW